MSLDDIIHKKFSYILIPYDINKEIEELYYEGKEEKFRISLINYLNKEKFNLLNKNNLYLYKQKIQQEIKGNINQQGIDQLVEGTSQNYQIIPLTLPTKENNYEGINAYIDSVGRIKELPTNARASRICSTDIRGDCFLSLVFDDEENFERRNFTIKDYQHLLNNPPDAKGRWSEGQAAMQLLQQTGQLKQEEPTKPKCENCGKEDLPLKKCSRCGKSYYCSVNCQKEDWALHKRICIPINK